MNAELPWLRRGIARVLAGRVRARAGVAGRVAIVKLDRLGDFVLALAAIKRLIRHHGEERCVLIISPAAAELAQREFPAVERVVLPASQGHARAVLAAWRHRRALGALGVTRTVCLRHQRWDYDELVLSWTGAAEHVRLETTFTARLQSGRRTFVLDAPGAHSWPRGENRWPPPEGYCQELLRHAELVAQATGDRPAFDALLPELTVSAPALGPVPAIVITPLGSAPVRDLPPPLLAAALTEIRARSAGPVIFLGSVGQKARLEKLVALPPLRNLGAVEVRTDLDLAEYLAVVASSPLVLTVETATAHLATAMNRPMVALIGGGHFGEFAPWHRSSRQTWLTERLDCFGCDWRCVHPAPYCLTRISPDRVVDAVRRQLAGALS